MNALPIKSKAEDVCYINFKLQPLQTISFLGLHKKKKKVAGKTINIICTFSSVSYQVRVLLCFLKLSDCQRFYYNLIQEHRLHSQIILQDPQQKARKAAD